MKLADIIAPEFIEHRVLPVVMAFGLGVIASAVAHDAERDVHRATVIALLNRTTHLVERCAQLPAISPRDALMAEQEVRP